MEESLSHRDRTRSRRWLILGVVAIVLVVLAAPALAGGRTSISGNSVPSDCNDGVGAGAIALTGDIEGCLTFFPEDYRCDELNGFDRYWEAGTEHFVGTYQGEAGEFTTTYTLEATFAEGFCDAVEAGGFPFELQLTGGCDHYVTGTSGAFEGVRGLITFFDVIPDPGTSGASNYLYAGRLRG